MILKEKIEDFLHHDYVRMVYIKKSSKIRLKFLGKLSRKISKKGVFHQRGHFGDILETFWRHFGDILETFRGHLEDI